MATSPLPLSKRSPAKSPSKRKVLEIQKKLLRKSPPGLKSKKMKKMETGNTKSKKSQICYALNVAFSAMERAEEVQANLATKFPSFVKPMLPSHVTGGFWLSFPKHFCDQHLPKTDETVVLVDEDEQAYKTKYLIDKNGLSGGWRGFSIAHKLLEGDVLVFQLIEPCKFKVYIVRANDLTEIDGAIGLLTLDAVAKPLNIGWQEKDMIICETAGEKWPVSLPLDSHRDSIQEKGMMALDADFTPAADLSGNDSDDFGSEVFDGIRFSDTDVDFKEVKCIEDFNISVDGLIINSVIPIHLRTKYYELCCSQKSYLHNNLLKGLNCNLVAGIISETVNIADAIKACKLSTSRDSFEAWDKTLKGFEALGMAVGFLRARLNRLVILSYETPMVIESKRLERMQAEEEMRTLEEKLSNMKGRIRTLHVEIESLKVPDERSELTFQEEAGAPW
ncbi:unnamed protein product [Ilex paraguariensis]|uniref:TF-B3 domain-containing protein n=1 Tax=Ilex paraguariensis TaxID=185542 RepID=A0ABC8S4R0_9AQUA